MIREEVEREVDEPAGHLTTTQAVVGLILTVCLLFGFMVDRVTTPITTLQVTVAAQSEKLATVASLQKQSDSQDRQLDELRATQKQQDARIDTLATALADIHTALSDIRQRLPYPRR